MTPCRTCPQLIDLPPRRAPESALARVNRPDAAQGIAAMAL